MREDAGIDRQMALVMTGATRNGQKKRKGAEKWLEKWPAASKTANGKRERGTRG